MIKKHIDFKIYPVSWISIIAAILIVPCVKYLPVEFGYENGLLENIQMVILTITMFFGFFAKANKKFFKFISLFVIILILREINCGRTIFFPVPDTVNTFYKWKDIKYGYLAHPLYGLYIGIVGLYFIINKLYLDLFKIIKTIKFPFWNCLLLVISVALGLYSDKAIDDMVLEEMIEILSYSSFMGIVWLYGFNGNFILKEEN